MGTLIAVQLAATSASCGGSHSRAHRARVADDDRAGAVLGPIGAILYLLAARKRRAAGIA